MWTVFIHYKTNVVSSIPYKTNVDSSIPYNTNVESYIPKYSLMGSTIVAQLMGGISVAQSDGREL